MTSQTKSELQRPITAGNIHAAPDRMLMELEGAE
jgi:hypothetical protein